MNGLGIFLSILELFFVSIVISLDNAVLIGSLTKDLPKKTKKTTNFIGALLGLILRLLLVALFYYILNIGGDDNVPVVYVIGGILILLAGLLITNPKKTSKKKPIKIGTKALKIILIIFSVDAMLSLDNSIIIAAKGNDLSSDITWWEILVMVLATLVSFPIILFGAQLLSHFMKKWKWIIYLASIFLVSIGIGMIIKDPIFKISLNIWITNAINFGGAFILVSFKWVLFDRRLK